MYQILTNARVSSLSVFTSTCTSRMRRARRLPSASLMLAEIINMCRLNHFISMFMYHLVVHKLQLFHNDSIHNLSFLKTYHTILFHYQNFYICPNCNEMHKDYNIFKNQHRLHAGPFLKSKLSYFNDILNNNNNLN